MTLTLERLKAIPVEFHTNFNNRAFDKQAELVTEDIEFFQNGVAAKGIEDFLTQLEGLTHLFNDAVFEDEEVYAEGNIAITRFSLTGSLTGDITFPDGTFVAANHKAVHYDCVAFFECNDDGKVTQIRQINDSGITPYTIEAQVK
ncbi:nuclear transport factor 2 family protein [Listeria sp. FSL L7-1582]|uniref:nuclear transport factor 2 family protein n=1 Tax=Listeria portnoyi TaxID=2713504 RepID=UPI00164DA4B4|nr:nuclear transport factor 2 family protein [Listeria portnoyi]MBC6310086.1 nuclear transport factor 2 family protein [Listeria portnoyi]